MLTAPSKEWRMLTIPFRQWRQQRRCELLESNPEVECPYCEGEGATLSQPDHRLADFCEPCEGTGYVPYRNVCNDYDRVHLNTTAYQMALRADLFQLCTFTGADFLAVAGREIHQQREAGLWP